MYDLKVGDSVTSLQQVEDATGQPSALRISTNNVIVGEPNWDTKQAVLGVIATPPTNSAHFQFGNPHASSGFPSARLTFAGWDIQHAGFVWTPALGGERGEFMLTFGANNDPAENTRYLILGNDGTTAFPRLPHLPASGTADLVIRGDGYIETQTSSLSFKEHVEPLTDDFHKILALQPKSFADKRTGDQGIGYVAEELDELNLKNLVGYDADGKPLTINYKLIPVYLLEVLKGQQQMIKELQAEGAGLKLSREE